MRAPSWKLVGAALVVVGAAYGLGRTTGASSGAVVPPAAPMAAPLAPRPVVISQQRADSIDAEQLRAIVREELAALGEERAERRAEELEAERARTEGREQALEQASAVVSAGLVDGVWSEEERAALREQLPKLGERELHAVLSPLFVAINAQRLRIDGPPI